MPRWLTDLLILTVLALHLVAFKERESVFPFLSYDVYREPIPKPELKGFARIQQARFYALDAHGKYEELGPYHPFYLPFDRALFAEVLFFDIVRVHQGSPVDYAEITQRRIRAQMRAYRGKVLRRVDVYWADISVRQNPKPVASIHLGNPILAVPLEE